MKLKLSNTEMMLLYELLTAMHNKFVCEDMGDKLLHVLLTCIYMKLHKISIIKKPEYRVKISEAEAMAFYISLERHNLGFGHSTGNLINKINNEIHQKFSI